MNRARNIVRLAARMSPSAHDWLIRDEGKVHEQSVAQYLELTAKEARERLMTPDQVDKAIARQIALDAREAMAIALQAEELNTATKVAERATKGRRASARKS